MSDLGIADHDDPGKDVLVHEPTVGAAVPHPSVVLVLAPGLAHRLGMCNQICTNGSHDLKGRVGDQLRRKLGLQH